MHVTSHAHDLPASEEYALSSPSLALTNEPVTICSGLHTTADAPLLHAMESNFRVVDSVGVVASICDVDAEMGGKNSGHFFFLLVASCGNICTPCC